MSVLIGFLVVTDRELPASIATPLLGLRAPWLFGSGHCSCVKMDEISSMNCYATMKPSGRRRNWMGVAELGSPSVHFTHITIVDD